MTEQLETRFLAARRAFIAAEFSHLNPQQREGVLNTEGPLLLLAGAGSGKTTVLINRIANLIRFGRASDSNETPDWLNGQDVEFLEQYLASPDPADKPRAESLCALDPARPWSILAITFTNKAANELKDRLEAMLGPEGRDVWAMTFHAACCRILRREIECLGYTSSFTIYDTADSERVIKDALRELNLDEKTYPPKSVLTRISRAKDRMLTPELFQKEAAGAGDYRLIRIAELYASYQQRLRAANAVDFDDIILLTVQILQEHEEIRAYWQRKFHYVMVDEYQDTNHMQYLLTSLLAGGYENICVVGDDDQSIYRFRGATIENILGFEQQYRGARVIRLEQNYRSTGRILDAANAVIANNRGRKGKKLWTKNETGDRIEIYEAASESDEANFAANRIFRMTKGQNLKDFAVLYRTNAQSNALEYAFKRNGIPYRIIGGTRFFDRAEVKDMLAYLCVINNPSDDLRLRRIINTPARGIGGKTLEMAERQALAADLPLYSVISRAKQYPSLEKAAAKLAAFTDLIETCAELAVQMPLDAFYDELLVRTGYLAMLESKDDVESRTRAENVRELKSSILSYMQNEEEPSLAGFLEEIALYTDIEQYDETADAVVMMTIHSAKGLEFPNVVLVGMEDGLFPGQREGSQEEMEEERRLCYVAITRAKKTLALTYARQRMLYGRTMFNRPSRFLMELPEDGVTGKPEKKQTPEHTESRRRSCAEFGDTQWERAAPSVPKPSVAPTASRKPSGRAAALFAKGDMVEHTAFGAGMVLSVLPMGNDALLEIAFDNIGTKRLMANAAASHMKKKT